jgi:hypothetical protein
MVARGFGKTRPVAPDTLPNGSDNPDGRQKKRRVEITFTTAQWGEVSSRSKACSLPFLGVGDPFGSIAAAK